MNPLPNDWLALLAVVHTLGLKHGMDPDHVATIDGIARWSGFQFSAGPGAIVILVAVGVSPDRARRQSRIGANWSFQI